MKRLLIAAAVLLLGPGAAWARWYDPGTGAFLSRDPECKTNGPECYRIPSPAEEVQAASAPQLNKYDYAKNNPLRYVDPNGKDPVNIGPICPECSIEYAWLRVVQFFGGGQISGSQDGHPVVTPAQGGVGGVTGGVVRAATFRAVPQEQYPSGASQAGLDTGASLVPIADPAARLATGKTASGAETSRGLAAVQLGLDLLPAAEGVLAPKEPPAARFIVTPSGTAVDLTQTPGLARAPVPLIEEVSKAANEVFSSGGPKKWPGSVTVGVDRTTDSPFVGKSGKPERIQEPVPRVPETSLREDKLSPLCCSEPDMTRQTEKATVPLRDLDVYTFRPSRSGGWNWLEELIRCPNCQQTLPSPPTTIYSEGSPPTAKPAGQ